MDKLDLSECRLDAIPPEVLELTNLEELALNGNQLAELPDGLSRLTNLKRLGLAGNMLTRLPPGIGQLRQLEGLWVHGNSLTDLPTELAQLTALKQLQLSGNCLTSLPDAFSGMSALEDFGAAGNALTTLPPSIGGLSRLKKLSLHGNRLSALPHELGRLSALQELWLMGNELQELQAPALEGLTALQQLSVADNRLASLPPALSRLVSLRKLFAYGNAITSLPTAALAALPALDSLWLEGNPLAQEALWALLSAAAAMPAMRSLGLDQAQLALDGKEGAAAASLKCVKPGMVLGSGPGYFKLQPGGPAGSRGRVLVVAFGSAPGVPNWGGLLAKVAAAPCEGDATFDTLFVVDAHRSWYGIGDQAEYDYYRSRIAAYSKEYERVVLVGDSMGATAALAFAPLATCVMAFCPQVDLSASSIRPGQPAAWFEALRGRLLAAVSDSKAEVVVCVGTWAHDLDQARALPQERIKMQVFSVESHRLALALDSGGKLMPLVRDAIWHQLGIKGGTVRLQNLL